MVTETRNGERGTGNGERGTGNGLLVQGTSTGNGRMEIKRLIGQGFKLGFVPILLFPLPVLVPRYPFLVLLLSGRHSKCPVVIDHTFGKMAKRSQSD